MSLSRKIRAVALAAGTLALTAAALPGPAAAKQPFQSLAGTDAVPMSAAEMEATQGKFDPIMYWAGFALVLDGRLALSLGNPLGLMAIEVGTAQMIRALTAPDPFAHAASPVPAPGAGGGSIPGPSTPTRQN